MATCTAKAATTTDPRGASHRCAGERIAKALTGPICTR
jgi:hypothetical protein